MPEKIFDKTVDVFAGSVDVIIGLAQGIPGVAAAVNAAKLYGTIRDHLFMRQVEGFLRELDKIPKEERDAFVQSLEDRGEKSRFGDTVTLILAQLDDLEKSTIIGRLYSAAIRGNIELHVAQRVSAMVSRSYVADFPALRPFRERVLVNEDNTIVAGLAAIGFLNTWLPQQSAFARVDRNGEAFFQVSEFGAVLLEYGLA